MKILTELQAVATDGELREPRGILTVVHAEPVAGVHVKVQLGSAGLFLRRGPTVAAFPLAALIELAARHAPDLTGVTPPPDP